MCASSYLDIVDAICSRAEHHQQTPADKCWKDFTDVLLSKYIDQCLFVELRHAQLVYNKEKLRPLCPNMAKYVLVYLSARVSANISIKR